MPRIPGGDEYDGDFGADPVIAADEYRMRIKDWKEYTQPPGLYNKTEEERVLFRLQPIHQVDDPEVELVDRDTGEPVGDDFTIPFFYDPKRTGIWNGKVAKSRKFLAAALQVPVEEPIEFDSYDDLVGKEVIGVVEVKKNKDGDNVNRIESVRPFKRGKKNTATAAAKEVFKDDLRPVPEGEEDLEF